MNYKYDYFISCGCLLEDFAKDLDSSFVDAYNSFIDSFVSQLENNSDFQNAFGRKARVFCCRSPIESLADWYKTVFPEMAASRVMIPLLSPFYFKDPICYYEFLQWKRGEVYTRLIDESVIPMFILEYSPQNCNFEKDLPKGLIEEFPYASFWVNYLRNITTDSSFDMHDFQTSKISCALNQLVTLSKSRFEKQDKCDNVPCNDAYPQLTDHFVGRQDILNTLRRELTYHNYYSDSKRPILLYGMDGVGKTETALAYGDVYGWDYGLGRILVPCENKTSLSSALLSSGIAELYGWTIPAGTEYEQLSFLLQKIQQKCLYLQLKQKRNNQDGNVPSSQRGKSQTDGMKMLLILDNVNQHELLSEKSLELLPNYIHVIATSSRITSQLNHLDALFIPPLQINESVELLKSYRPLSDNGDAAIAQDIAEFVDGFAAPLAQIGLYLQKNEQYSYSKLYEEMKDNSTAVLQKAAKHFQETTHRPAESIVDTIQTTYNKLSPEAKLFLDYSEIMAVDAVPLPWIRSFFTIDNEQFEAVVKELQEYNILTLDQKEPCLGIINSLIMRFKAHENEEMVQSVVPVLFEHSKMVLNSDWSNGGRLWALEAIDGFFTTYLNSVNNIQEWIKTGLPDLIFLEGQIYKDLKFYDYAKDVFTKNVDVCRRILSVIPDDIQILTCLSSSYERLGNIEFEDRSGNPDNARQWYEAELNIDQQLAIALPDDEIIQTNLAMTYIRMSDVEKYSYNLKKTSDNLKNAMEWLQKALDYANCLNTKIQSNNDILQVVFSSIYSRIADLELIQNNYDSARQWYYKSREIDECRAQLMPDYYKVQDNLAVICSKIADLEIQVGNFNEAVNLYQKVMNIRERVAQGMPNVLFVHQQLYEACSALAKTEMKAGNVDDAERHLFNKIAILNFLIRSVPDDVALRIDSGDTKLTLGDINLNKNDVQAAQILYQDAIEDFKSVLSIQAKNDIALSGLCCTWNRIGDLAKRANDLNNAIRAYCNGIEACVRFLAINNNNTALHVYSQMLNKVGLLYYISNDRANAADFLMNAVTVLDSLVQKRPNNKVFQEELEMSQSIVKCIENYQAVPQELLSNLLSNYFGYSYEGLF